MTSQLEIQRYLRSKDRKDLPAVFTRLEAEYGITAKQHSKCPNLWLFKYSQIDSNFADRIVQECRGIILDEENNWAVVAMPFTKFFNSVEPLAGPIDWYTARVQEKLDGSLITLYRHAGKWHVATSGCPDGTNQVGDFSNTFEDFFWSVFDKQGLWTGNLNLTYTYMWELTSPFNRVVVDHKESAVTLIGARNNTTLRERPVREFEGVFPIVSEYPLGSIEECLEAANKLNPLNHEGFVVVDSSFHRVKIKSPAYVAIHHIKDSCSHAKLAEIIRNGEYQEFLIAIDSYPEIKKQFQIMAQRYDFRIDCCTKIYEKLCGIKEQKEFAIEALKYDRNSHVLFGMRKTGKSAKAIVKNMTRNAYLNWLDVKENDL